MDKFYRSAEWLALRKAALKRDNYRCIAPGCGKPAVIVDHIVSRRAGGQDTLSNLRCLCRSHDAAIKEDHLGRRRGGR